MILLVFIAANVLVLGTCIWVSLSDRLVTGFWGTTGIALVGLAAAINLFKPMWMREAVDGPEVFMVVGMAIGGVWLMARTLYWSTKGHRHGSN